MNDNFYSRVMNMIQEVENDEFPLNIRFEKEQTNLARIAELLAEARQASEKKRKAALLELLELIGQKA